MAGHLRIRLTDLIYKLYPLLKNQGELWETNEMLINEGLPSTTTAGDEGQRMAVKDRKNEG
jgi:hypothetical protein